MGSDIEEVVCHTVENAEVEWAETSDDEHGSAAGITVKMLSNGWIYTPGTEEYHPPHTVDRVSQYSPFKDEQTEDSENDQTDE